MRALARRCGGSTTVPAAWRHGRRPIGSTARTEKDAVGAARAATALSCDALLFGAGVAVARGWWGQARDLLEAIPERAEHGWLAVREGELALEIDQDADAARSAGDRAQAIGRRQGDVDLQFVGMALSGRAATSAGDPASGMPQLDTAVAAATAGEVSDLMWMGKICCWQITACQETQDLGRADEWCRRVEAICQQQNLTPLFNVCRLQHSSILIARGAWSQADRGLHAVLDGAATSRRNSRLDAVVQLGELRRRQGRWTEAERAAGAGRVPPVSHREQGHDPAGARRLERSLGGDPPTDPHDPRVQPASPRTRVVTGGAHRLRRGRRAQRRATPRWNCRKPPS